jgi:GT2 family glycosyltransferase
MDVDVVIVNWNGGELVRRCVGSLAAVPESECALRVVVVDNGSADGSWEGLESVDARVRVVRNERTRGFAAACNQGAAVGTAPFVLFLNPDTVVTSASIAGALRFMRSPEAADVGIAGVQLVDESGAVSRSCARFPTAGTVGAAALGLDRVAPRLFAPHFMSEWDHGSSRVVDQVIGAFFLTRRPLFERLGGFDERFFVYYEEVDLAYRARLAGWRSYFLATVSAVHTGCGTTDRVRATRYFYVTRSRILYGFKHFGVARGAALAAAAVVAEPLVRCAAALARGTPTAARETLAGARMLWRDLPNVLRTATNARSAGG